MADPTGGSLDFRITIERENAQAVAQTRKEISGLVGDVQNLNRTSSGSTGAVAAFAGSMFKTEQAATTSGKGVLALRQAITGLAFQATGTAGPVGRLASALLLFAGGSSLVIGVAAGIGAIATAYKLAAATANELRDSTERLNLQWREIIARGKPVVALQNELITAQQKATEATERFTRLRSTVPSPRGPVARGTPGEIALAQSDVDAANRVVGALRLQLRGAKIDLGQELAKTTLQGLEQALSGAQTSGELRRIFNQGMAEIAKITDPQVADQLTESLRGAFIKAVEQLQASLPRGLAGLMTEGQFAAGLGRRAQLRAPTFGANFRAGGPEALAAEATAEYNKVLEESRRILGSLLTPQQLYSQNVSILNRAFDLGIISAEQLAQAMKGLKEEMDKASDASPVLAASIITAVAGTIAAIASGGGIGSVLSGIGGIVSLIPGGQIVGAAIAGAGIIASGFESGRGVRIDSYSAQALDQLRANDRGAERVTVILVDPTTGAETEYQARRRTRRDAVDRIPTRA